MKQASRSATRAKADDQSPTPLYHQIFLQLRERIYDGTYPAGSLLPGEHELMRQFEVSRITAKRALDELALAKLVVRKPGQGTRVVRRAPVVPVEASVESALESARIIGRTQVSVLGFDFVPAPPEVAAFLGIEAGTTVHRAERVRRLPDAPFSHVTTYVPAELGHGFTEADLAKTPLTALLARQGAVIRQGEQRVSATVADSYVAGLLGIEAGAPLLRIVSIMCDADGHPIEMATALYRSDLYQFSIRLRETESAPDHRSATDRFPDFA